MPLLSAPQEPQDHRGSRAISLTFIKFGIVGALGVGVNLGALWAAQRLGVTTNIASAIAIEVSIISNFILNDQWTFREVNDERAEPLSATPKAESTGWLQRALRFQLVSGAGALVQWSVFVALNLLWAYLELNASTSGGVWAQYQDMINQGAWHQIITRPPEVGAWIYLSQMIGIGCATAWNFLVNYYWTWADRDS